VRGIGVFAMLAGALTAGCSGGSSGPRPPAAQTAPDKTTQSAGFEAFRASSEEQVRRSAPAGFDVFVGSTYVVKRGASVLVFSDRQVAMKTARAIGSRTGSQSSVYARSDVTEIPKSFFQTAPRGRQTSTVHQICNPEGCPDPPPPPDPTPGPNGFYDGGAGIISSGATTQAQSIASTRQAPCTQDFTTNNYPGGVTMSYSPSGNTWTLQYRPGFPYFNGGTDTADVTEGVRLVDGTLLQTVMSVLIPNNQVVQTSFSYTAGDITTVKYAAIQVIEHPYSGDNVIAGQANVTCVGDADRFVNVPVFPPPHIPDPPRPPNTN
jgi:hypothetical protein